MLARRGRLDSVDTFADLATLDIAAESDPLSSSLLGAGRRSGMERRRIILGRTKIYELVVELLADSVGNIASHYLLKFKLDVTVGRNSPKKITRHQGLGTDVLGYTLGYP
jgi:hypothetical protein